MGETPLSRPRLSVNLNKIALVRNARGGRVPNLSHFATLAAEAGAQGLTVHPRPDQRHIRVADILPLRRLSEQLGLEFNIEGNPFAAAHGSYPGLLQLLRDSLPDQCTLVPDTADQLTSDHGFELADAGPALRPVIAELAALQIRCSLFMDPQRQQMDLAAEIGAQRVELYTGPYAEAAARQESEEILDRYREAAAAASAAGLGVNAGHDLDLNNLGTFVRAVPNLAEVSIGHALIADALELGFDRAVRAYLAQLQTD